MKDSTQQFIIGTGIICFGVFVSLYFEIPTSTFGILIRLVLIGGGGIILSLAYLLWRLERIDKKLSNVENNR